MSENNVNEQIKSVVSVVNLDTNYFEVLVYNKDYDRYAIFQGGNNTIRVGIDGNKLDKAKIRFKLSDLDINDLVYENIISVKLQLICDCVAGLGLITVADKEVCMYAGQSCEVEILDKITALDEQVDIELNEKDGGGFLDLCITGVYAPSLKVEYVVDGKKNRPIRDVNNIDGVTHKVNLQTGEINTVIKDIVAQSKGLSLGITHNYKNDLTRYGVGNYFRLNLHEKLTKVNTDLLNTNYVYEDELGVKHTFEEKYFFYEDNDDIRYVDKADIEIDLNGNLTTLWGNKIRQVYSTHYSSSGYKLETTKQGFLNTTYLETKSEEELAMLKQIEEGRKYLGSLLYWDLSDAPKFLEGFENPKKFYDFINEVGNNYLLTYESYKKIKEIPLAWNQESFAKNICINNEIETIKKYYENFLIVLRSYQTTEKKTPVSYLYNDTIIKGFNSNGDLAVISDRSNNAIWIERDFYNRIIRLTSEKEVLLTFDYVGDNLTKIISNTGEHVEYEYSDYRLSKIKYSNGRVLELKYLAQGETYYNNETGDFTDNVTVLGREQILSVRDKKNRIEDEFILDTSTGYVSDIKFNAPEYTALEDSIIYSVVLGREKYTFGSNQATVEDQEKPLKEYYLFDDNGFITEYFKELNDKVTYAERYTHKDYDSVKIEYANKSNLNLSPFYSFDFGNTDYVETKNDSFYKTYQKITYKYISGTKKLKDNTLYYYDKNNNCTKEKTTSMLTNDGVQTAYVYITDNYYNAEGRLVKVEKFTEGEEKTYGKNVTELFYDDKGNVIKEITYNTLDTTKKLYKEQNFDDFGNVIEEYCQKGEYNTKYNYYKDNALKETLLPNDSKIVYSYDNDNLSGITQSTTDGEENSNQIYYNYGHQTKVVSNDFSVGYNYNNKRKLIKVVLNGSELFRLSYTGGDGVNDETIRKRYPYNETDSTYDYFDSVYDYKGNLKETKYAKVLTASSDNMITQMGYEYDDFNKLTRATDSVAGITHSYAYDEFDRETNHTFGNTMIDNVYGISGELLSTSLKHRDSSSTEWENVTPTLTYNYSYTNDSKKRLTQMNVGSLMENYEYDSLERTKKISQTINYNTKYSKDYGYYKNGDHATGLVNSVFYKKNELLTDREYYTYDSMGNITDISKNGVKVKEYRYDSLNRLIYENNLDTGREISYTYDRQGNILSKVDNGVKIDYVYDENGFKLLSYGTRTYNYDNLGNPLNLNTYYYNLVWDKAHQLKTANGVSGYTLNFTYDGNGLMKGKVGYGDTCEYVYENGRLIRETIDGVVTDFLYGQEGLLGFVTNGETYLYEKNIFGDIVKIHNGSGEVVGEYSYTAFGECSVITDVNSIATKNKFRYRGYYYLPEMELYYLKTRFYNPKTGRFISPDDTKYLQPDVVNGLNLYAYCNNNPISFCDPSGRFAISTLIIGTVIGAVIGGATSAISQGLTKGWDSINGWQVLLDATIGGISGALGASGINQVVSMISGGVLGAAGSIGGDLIAFGGDWSDVNIGKAILMGVIGVGLGRWTGAGTQNSKAMVNTINAGKSWGSKAFLTSAKETLLRPNSALTLQTMYMNMAKAISLYTVQGVTKVTSATVVSTFLGNLIGW